MGRTTSRKSPAGKARRWANWLVGACDPPARSVFVICWRVSSMDTNGYRYTYASTATSWIQASVGSVMGIAPVVGVRTSWIDVAVGRTAQIG